MERKQKISELTIACREHEEEEFFDTFEAWPVEDTAMSEVKSLVHLDADASVE